MLGAGIVFIAFGLVALAVGKSLDGGGSDAFALAGLLPMLAGIGLLALGGLCVLMGL